MPTGPAGSAILGAMSTETLSVRQLNRATLARQLLLARERLGVVEAVDRLAGLQAQEARPPFVGLWARLDGFDRDQLHASLHDRTVVRATWLRATLHLVSAADYVALRGCLLPTMDAALRVLGARAQGLEIDKLLPVARELLAEAPRSFNELRLLLAERFPEADERALGYATRLTLPLVMVPTEDRWGFPSIASFTPAEAWLGEPMAEQPPMAALARRHLAAFGPASAADLQTWAGTKGARAVLEGMGSELRVFRDERGRTLYDLPDAPRPDPDTPVPARFLPDFDNLVLAHEDRTRVLPEAHKALVVTRNLRVRATFMLDGMVRGTWAAARKRAGATLTLTPFERLPKGAEDELAPEGEALLRFLEPDADSTRIELAEPSHPR